MKEYHKINSVFKRDENGKFTGEFAIPEFEYLRKNLWTFDEKVDGTNIRVMWDGGEKVRFGGKTDAAQIPATLFEVLQAQFPIERFKATFPQTTEVTLYGEGYGAKIQKGGGNYKSNGQAFVLFDIMVANWWLLRQDVEDVAKKMEIKVVPIIRIGTLDEAISLTKDGITSQWGSFQAEGIVLRPMVPLRTRRGDRIITKLKHKDWK